MLFLHRDLHFHWSQIIVDYYKILSESKSWIWILLTSHPKHQHWQQLLRLKDLLTTPTPGCVTLSFIGTYLFPLSDEWMASNSRNLISLFSCSVPFFPNLVIYSSAVRYWKGMTEYFKRAGWLNTVAWWCFMRAVKRTDHRFVTLWSLRSFFSPNTVIW